LVKQPGASDRRQLLLLHCTAFHSCISARIRYSLRRSAAPAVLDRGPEEFWRVCIPVDAICAFGFFFWRKKGGRSGYMQRIIVELHFVADRKRFSSDQIIAGRDGLFAAAAATRVASVIIAAFSGFRQITAATRTLQRRTFRRAAAHVAALRRISISRMRCAWRHDDKAVGCGKMALGSHVVAREPAPTGQNERHRIAFQRCAALYLTTIFAGGRLLSAAPPSHFTMPACNETK
jgi:hypothetical protein